MKIGDIVYIEFEDHATDMNSWTNKDQWLHTVCPVNAIGFILRNTDKYLTISQLMQPNIEVASQSFTVIKSCITKIKRINVK